jgi:hypothetical protein
MPSNQRWTTTPVALAAIALCAVVGGCDTFNPPPAQLDALLTLERTDGEPTSDALRALSRDIVSYLAVKGLTAENARVTYDKVKKLYHFEVVGREPLPAPLLDQVTAAIAASDKDKSWKAQISVAKLDELDGMMKTKEREFPVEMQWKNAKVGAYVANVTTMDLLSNLRAGGERPMRMVSCMLLFSAEKAMPKLEGTFEERYGKSIQGNSSYLMKDRVFLAPYEVAFDEPRLVKKFEEAPTVKDGMLAFEMSTSMEGGLIDGGSQGSMDISGKIQGKCERALKDGFPDVAAAIERGRLLSSVKAIGPARKIALVVAAKK